MMNKLLYQLGKIFNEPVKTVIADNIYTEK